MYGRVDISGPGTHHKAFERCHSHRSVYAAASLNGGGAGAISQMKGNEIHAVRRLAQIPGSLSRDIRVRSAVKPVPANVEVPVPLMR